jgi:hypothetical protein
LTAEGVYQRLETRAPNGSVQEDDQQDVQAT